MSKDQPINIYDLLSDEHIMILASIERLKDIRVDGRKRLLEEVIDDITSHSQAEEQVLYDRVADATDLKQLVFEAKEEHLMVTRLLEDLYGMRVEDERFEAKVKVLGELLRHHIEEEENEMFPKSQEMFDDVIAQNFAGEFMAEKEKVLKMPQLLRLGQARMRKVVDDVSHAIRPEGDTSSDSR